MEANKRKLDSSSKARIAFCALLALVGMYFIAVYSNIPFIAKWRTIYIETAMSTMTHQWLATAFIPSSVVNEVVDNMQATLDENIVSSSDIPEPDSSKTLEEAINDLDMSAATQQLEILAFQSVYDEIDMNTMPEVESYLDLQISDCVELGIKTKQGDSVWAIDVPNRLIIVEVTGSGFVGKLAIIKDSSQVYLHNNTKTSRGSTVTEHCEEGDAILGINASGFMDYDGKGNGASPIGLIISNGTHYHGLYNASNYQIAGFDYDDNFRMGRDIDTSTLRDAVQFYPIIILNGEKKTNGSYGLGIQPRSMIGQTVDKETLMLIVDGRQIGYSLGATVSDCADILLGYGCYNAMNLDGGSSASMTYNGEMITKTSSPMATGRYLPDAWVVKKLSEVAS